MATGILYIVATPIGNLEDITFRAVRILKEVDLIAAEDTRHSSRLLKHYGITTPTTSYHDYTDSKKRASLMRRLATGDKIALISDAGTPGISDPGYRLISEAVAGGIEVTAVPGPSVLTAALSAAGLPTDAFYFNGYLPNRAAARRKVLRSLAERRETLVLYEAPHRITASLSDMKDLLGNRRIAVCREMTKLHEEIFRGNLEEALQNFSTREKIRGEFTLVVEGAKKDPALPVDLNLPDEITRAMEGAGVNRKEAVRIVAERFGLPKKVVYRASLTDKDSHLPSSPR
ncbi:MAG: 16S rRNA (cytidine(1402)-2'-O)-methyltransferase [Deltaproteobacteria bacterium]|nr:16S rRNA (cytidine(1402)-2'-O)-methyltransferase [Deltaproteobacteria bacterium]